MSVRTSRGALLNCKNCGGIGQVFKVDRGEHVPCPCTAGITLQAEPAPASASPPTEAISLAQRAGQVCRLLRSDSRTYTFRAAPEAANVIDALVAENQALRNLANNLQPGPISVALGGAEHEKPFRLAAGFTPEPSEKPIKVGDRVDVLYKGQWDECGEVIAVEPLYSVRYKEGFVSTQPAEKVRLSETKVEKP